MSNIKKSQKHIFFLRMAKWQISILWTNVWKMWKYLQISWTSYMLVDVLITVQIVHYILATLLMSIFGTELCLWKKWLVGQIAGNDSFNNSNNKNCSQTQKIFFKVERHWDTNKWIKVFPKKFFFFHPCIPT